MSSKRERSRVLGAPRRAFGQRGDRLGAHGPAWSVHLATVLHSVDEQDLFVFEDLADDAVVGAPCRSETLQFAYERFAEPLGVACDRPRMDSSAARTLSGSRLRCRKPSGVISISYTTVASDVVAETQPLAL